MRHVRYQLYQYIPIFPMIFPKVHHSLWVIAKWKIQTTCPIIYRYTNIGSSYGQGKTRWKRYWTYDIIKCHLHVLHKMNLHESYVTYKYSLEHLTYDRLIYILFSTISKFQNPCNPGLPRIIGQNWPDQVWVLGGLILASMFHTICLFFFADQTLARGNFW